jgi:hypothetical protein
MKVLPLIAACALLGATATANASTFIVSGTANNSSGGTLGSCANLTFCDFSGTLDINVATGVITGWDITFPGLPGFTTMTVFGAGQLRSIENGYIFTLLFDTGQTPPSLVGYSGGPITGESVVRTGGAGTVYGDLTGSITPTPLPAALPLFATGIGGLGLLGWRRKRKAQAVA